MVHDHDYPYHNPNTVTDQLDHTRDNNLGHNKDHDHH